MELEGEGFIYYLKKRRKVRSSGVTTLYIINQFVRWLYDREVKIESLDYAIVMEYVSYCKSRGNSQHTISSKVRLIKYWCDYRFIEPNPCKGWYIKSRRSPMRENILSAIQMNQMYYDHPESTAEEIRDKVMLGLMIYQGMDGGQMQRLKLSEVNMEVGFIIIKKTLRTVSRSIKIDEKQQQILRNYIEKSREQLLAKEVITDLLIVNDGSCENMRGFYNSFYKRFRKRYEQFENVKQTRASVITNWLKSYNLREVQYMAGHRYVSSTERYLQSRVEDLQKALDEKHPLR